MLGRTNAGGGMSLNFQIVGGTTQPTGPKENTIWVSTSEKITSWVLSATEPKAPEEGMVWITYGTSGAIEINALKKNGIQFFPVSAKQYVSGSWTARDMKVYQDGSWGVSIRYLHKNGDQCTSETGGWQTVPIFVASDYPMTKGTPTVTTYNQRTTIQIGASWKAGLYVTKNKIDLGGFRTLTAKVSNVSNGASEINCALCIYTNIGNYAFSDDLIASADIKTNASEVKLTIPSNAGMCCVGFFLISGNNASSFTLSELKCE